MKKVFRIANRVLIAILLLIALSALIIWPLANDRAIGLSGFRSNPGDPLKGRFVLVALRGRILLNRDEMRGPFEETSSPMSWQYKWKTAGGWRWSAGQAEVLARANMFTESLVTHPVHWHPYDIDLIGQISGYQLIISDWLIALVAAIWPTVCLFLWNRRRRIRRQREMQGHCPACGYDLRATPEKGGELLNRCPECGVARA